MYAVFSQNTTFFTSFPCWNPSGIILVFPPASAHMKVSVSQEQEKWSNIPFVRSGVSCRFIISGTEGPYTSVSSSPTPLFGSIVFSAAERLTNKRKSNAIIVNRVFILSDNYDLSLPTAISCQYGHSTWVGYTSLDKQPKRKWQTPTFAHRLPICFTTLMLNIRIHHSRAQKCEASRGRNFNIASFKENSPAVVDFPTPPFPEATSIICLTPVIGFCFGSPRAMSCACLSSNFELSFFWRLQQLLTWEWKKYLTLFQYSKTMWSGIRN